MAERFAKGSRVRVHAVDPAHHTRVPRYVRGHVGVVIGVGGEFPLPDDRFIPIKPQRRYPLYTVRFPATELWGSGDHTVTVQCWESQLDPVVGR